MGGSHTAGVNTDVCASCGATGEEIIDGRLSCSAAAVAEWRAGAERRRVERDLDLWKQDLDYREAGLVRKMEAIVAVIRKGAA